MSSLDDKRFLIRSSGHILGPFFKNEVIDLIKKGKISIFDEVAEPYTIWFYLQDHSDFKKIVHSMSMQTRLVNFLSSVHTKISHISKNTKDKTTEQTTEKTLTETTTKAQTKTLSLSEKQAASEANIESLKPIHSSSSLDSGYKSETEADEVIRQKINLIVSWSWKSIVILIFLIGCYISYKEFYIPFQQKKIIQNNLHSKGSLFYTTGDFKRALPFFETAYSHNLLSDDEKISLAGMLIQANKISKAIAIKNEVLETPSFQKTEGALLDILIDYTQKNDDEFKNKAEFLIKNNRKPKATQITLFNLALFYWDNHNYKKSIELLDEFILRSDRNIANYLRALNLLNQNKLDELETYITSEEVGGLSFFNKKHGIKEFRQEFYFLLSYIYMKKGNRKELADAIIKLLNEDPFLYQDYKYSAFLAKNRLFNWNYFYSRCKEIFDLDPNNNLFKALHSFCHLKARLNPSSALNFIAQIKNTKDQNPLFLSLEIYFIMEKNKDNNIQLEESFSLINYKETKQPLPFILKARFFEKQKDWNTALLTWEQLISFDSDNLSGNAGVAFNSYQLGDLVKGETYLKKTLEKYPYYTKILPYKKSTDINSL